MLDEYPTAMGYYGHTEQSCVAATARSTPGHPEFDYGNMS